jgi:BirA family biotin operon repressor/biotin-[acetyl-CoA-carboxylase] ligase
MSTKGSVLKALEENKGTAVSGEELASRLDISRAAVWKAIQELRREGYRIDAITNRGYCLAGDSDVLSAEGILPYVKGDVPADRIRVFKSVESTNLTAKKIALDGAQPGTVIIAEEQTKGRGRMGRSFYSPPAGGIYMSFILKPRLDTAKSVLITTAASVAVCKAIEEVTGISCRIKWVNDIYKGDKKICGILTEAVTDFESGQIDYIVLGIGVNYNTARTDFPEELAGIAGSLFEEAPGCIHADGSIKPQNRVPQEISRKAMRGGGRCSARTQTCVSEPSDACNTAFFPQLQLQWKNGQQRAKRVGVPEQDVAFHEINKQATRNRLIAEIINQVLEINNKLETREFIREYKSRSLVLGKEILIIPTAGPDGKRSPEEGIPAAAVDIDEDGGLVIRYPDGSLQTLKSGEISIRTAKP